MYKIKLDTKYGDINLLVNDIHDEEVETIINQPYINSVYVRCIDEECKVQYKGIKKLKKENKKCI